MTANQLEKSAQSSFIQPFGWAALATVSACAACCAVPLLAAAGVGGALLTSLAAFVRPGVDVVVAAAVGITVLVVASWRKRSQAKQAVRDCANDTGCGCTAPRVLFRSPVPNADEPIVCTADREGGPTLKGQLDGYRDAFRHWLRTERFEHGYRWIFRAAPDLEARLERLMRDESRCCSFLELRLELRGDELAWTAQGTASAASVIADMANLPDRLR